ncbi:MAG: hypothetical protein H7841_07775 [Magnetospirillum sp. WYHS-4]
MTNLRRLSDHIMEAHTLACGEKRKEIAEILLKALEMELSRLGLHEGERRRSMAMQEEAFVRHRETFPGSHL